MDEAQIIKTYHETKNLVKTAAMLKIDHKRVSCILKRAGIEFYAGRKYEFDRDFFKSIDTEGKAYFLGFLWADGNNSGTGTVTLKLVESDREILERLNQEIHSTRPLRLVTNIWATNPKTGKRYASKDAYTLSISSKSFTSHLASIGLVPNKTKVLRLPQKGLIPDHLLHHFIRGYFDGDGSVSKWHQKGRNLPVYNMGIVMKNEGLAKDFRALLDSLGVDDVNYRIDNGLHRLDITSGPSRVKFASWLYQDASLYLARKKTIFDEIRARHLWHLDRRTSTVRGISLRNGVYTVRKYIKGVTRCLGRFRTEQEAINCLNQHGYATNITS